MTLLHTTLFLICSNGNSNPAIKSTDMKPKKYDNMWLGLGIGVVGALLGFMIFATGFSLYNKISIGEFVTDIFLGVQDFQSRIVTFSMLVDVILFFVLLKKNYLNLCKGIMAIMVISVAIVAMLY